MICFRDTKKKAVRAMDSLKTFWDGRGRMEKRLLLLVLALFVVLVIIFLFIFLSSSDQPCVTMECLSAATHLLDYVDPLVHPCDDFHKFVCGSYIKKANEFNKANALRVMQERMENRVDSIISGNPNDTSVYSLKLQRQFYRSCTNTSGLELDDNDTFLTLLDALGGWPVVKGHFWDENIFDWKTTMIKARKLGFSFQKLLGLRLNSEFENLTTIEITPPDEVERVPNEIREPYVELITDIAIQLHAPSMGIKMELSRVVDFQNELYRIVTKARNASEESKKYKVSEWQDKFLRISWLQFLNGILSGAATLKETDYIVVKSEQYIKDLELLVLKTMKRDQANYIIWKTVEKFVPLLTENIRTRYAKFQRQFAERKHTIPPRSDVCLGLAKDFFTGVAEIEYTRKYVSQETRRQIETIFAQVKDALFRRLKTSSTLTAELRKEVEEEMRNTTIFVGGSDQIFNVTEIEKHLGYNDLAFFDDNLVKMATKVAINRLNRLFSDIGNEDYRKSYYAKKPHTTVNAYYLELSNLLILPAPLLQNILYNENRPNYMNYGALVSTIGHEFAHSLSKLGNETYQESRRYIDYQYNHVFFEGFGNASKCFQEQYATYQKKLSSNPQTHIRTNETLEENLADYIGTDIAYELYENYVDEHGVDPRLPGVDYTPNQIFWIMTGTFLCKKPVEKETEISHADTAYRINYRLRNLPQFASDFHCPTGTFMNPENRCHLF